MSDVQFVVPGGAYSAGVSTGGNTLGNTGVTGTRLVLAGGSNVTLSQATDANGATVSVAAADAAAGGATLSAYWPYDWRTSGALGLAQTRPMFAPFILPLALSANTMRFLVSVAMTTSANTSTGSGAISMTCALYTQNNSTLSQLISGARTFTWTNSSNANLSLVTGIKAFDMSLSHTSILTPGHYWYAVQHEFDAAAGVGSVNWTFVGMTQGAGTPSGLWFDAPANGRVVYPGLGRYTVGSADLPASVAFTQINSDASHHRSVPYVLLLGHPYF